MAGKTNESALSKAVRGEKLTDRQAQSALGDALKRLSSLGKRTEKTKEAVVVTGTMVIHSAETQGTLFLSSMAEGFFGKEKLELGGVDVRAPTAIVTQGYGIYEALTGKSGGHALAIGNGLMGSWLASVGVSAGKTLRDKRNQPQQQPQGTQQPAQQPAATVTPTMQGNAEVPALPAPSLIPEPSLHGPLREVLLTPEADADEDEDFEGRRRGGRRRPSRSGRRRPSRSGRRGRPGRPSRFPRAELDDEGEDFDE